MTEGENESSLDECGSWYMFVGGPGKNLLNFLGNRVELFAVKVLIYRYIQLIEVVFGVTI